MGQASEEEFVQLVSSSFQPLMVGALPYPKYFSSVPCAPGGIWFWETYRHALFGENVILQFGGTGISLTEDFLVSQAKLRGEVCAEYTSSSLRSRCLLAHGTAKLEILYALSLAVSLHVAKHPVLDRGQGPRAVVLCATYSQCAEATTVLNAFCSSLHLVVHNLFDAYPSLPADKRADVVVGTPPLWEYVSQVASGASTLNLDVAANLGGLEDLLLCVGGGESQLPPAYNLSRWRPYGLAHVKQLVVFDVEQQVNMGFASIVHQICKGEHSAPNSPKVIPGSRERKGIPPSCQVYVVVGGDRWCADRGAVECVLRTVRERGSTGAKVGTAEIRLFPAASTTSSNRPRKRARGSEDAAQEEKTIICPLKSEAVNSGRPLTETVVPATPLVSVASPQTAFDGLLIRNAVSHARLLADFEALSDFKLRVTELAEKFWLSFESSAAAEACGPGAAVKAAAAPADISARSSATIQTSVLHWVRVDLALVCTRLASDSLNGGGVAETSQGEPTYRAQELGIWVHPSSGDSTGYASRLKLLFQHLFDELNGELFDGSIVQCVLAEDAPQLPYCLHPLQCSPLLEEAFSYGSDLERPMLLEIACKCKEGLQIAQEARANERLCVTAVKESGSLVTLDDEQGGVPASLFLLPKNSKHPAKHFRSSLPTVAAEVATIVVLRHLLMTKEEACGGGTGAARSSSDVNDKPWLLHVIEECCHYGRVLSYHVHEDLLHRPQKCPAQLQDSTETNLCEPSNEDAFWDAHRVALSIFIEFATPESACEAARQFAAHFAAHAAHIQLPEGQKSYVRLFRNSTYYQGVKQEESHDSGLHNSATTDDENDSMFGDLIAESLLAE